MDRKQIVMEVGGLLDKYCNGCFLKKHYKDSFSKNYAQKFCITKCTVGEQIRNYGELLEKPQQNTYEEQK